MICVYIDIFLILYFGFILELLKASHFESTFEFIILLAHIILFLFIIIYGRINLI